MPKILKDFYYGNLCPADYRIEKDQEAIFRERRYSLMEEEFRKLLDAKLQNYFDQYCEVRNIYLEDEYLDRFIGGFRYGMSFAIESMFDIK